MVHKAAVSEGSNWQFPKLRPEQKGVSWIRDLFNKLYQPGAVVMDHFADTLSTAKSYLSLKNYRRFIGCEIDVHFLYAGLSGFLL